MDLMTKMAEKVKDLVNPIRARDAGMSGPMAKAGH